VGKASGIKEKHEEKEKNQVKMTEGPRALRKAKSPKLI